MPEVSIKEVFSSSWGIVESRREEIERGSFGTFNRVLREEIEKLFYPLDKVAKLMDCCTSTARKWLWGEGDNDPRYIVQDGLTMYHKDDVQEAADHRKAVKQSKKKKVKVSA